MLSQRIGREGNLQMRSVFLSASAKETQEFFLCIAYLQRVYCVKETEVGMTRKEGGGMKYS